MKEKDISGLRFGRLVAVEKKEGGRWLFKCDCGNNAFIFKNNVMQGLTKSCGCLRKEVISREKKKHGLHGTKIYQAWRHMLDRCNNPNVERYPYYGGRGITVCSRWKSFENFITDMGLPPTPSHSIGRINGSLGYEKSNCQWETDKEQARNKSNTKLSVDIVNKIRMDKNKSGAEWGRELGCSKELINMVKRNEIWT